MLLGIAQKLIRIYFYLLQDLFDDVAGEYSLQHMLGVDFVTARSDGYGAGFLD